LRILYSRREEKEEMWMKYLASLLALVRAHSSKREPVHKEQGRPQTLAALGVSAEAQR
jgi:hypothetical protein